MNITIFASIWSQNLWDELILKNEIQILEKKYALKYNISKKYILFTIFSYDKNDIFYNSDNVRYVEYFPINIKKISNLFNNIVNFINFIKIVIKSDLIVIWWGWIFYDNENQSVWNPLKQWLFRSKIFKLFNKKVEFFRVWINIKNKKNLKIIKKIFFCATKISVRDNYSFKILQKLNLWKQIELLNDPVFLDKINSQKRKMSLIDNSENKNINSKYNLWNIKIEDLNVQNIEKIFQQGGFSPLSLSWKKIWLSLRDYNVENFEEKIIEIIKYLLENNAEIILIPHSFHKTDIKANDYIFLKKCRDVSLKHLNNNSESSSELQNKISICKNMQESYRIYTEKKIDLNLASRLHSIILSQVYKINFIAISYSTKTDEVISQLSNQNQDI